MVGETWQAEIHGPHVLYSNTPESGLGARDKMLPCSYPKPGETGGHFSVALLHFEVHASSGYNFLIMSCQ